MLLVVVGYGRAGKQHVAALSDSSRADLHAVLETDAGTDTGSWPRAESWDSVLADPAVDGISLCVPPGGRDTMARDALAAGKAVLLEKPPAMSVEELSGLDAAARSAGVPVAVMLQHRFALPQAALDASWGATATGTLLVSRPRPTAHFSGWRADAGAALGGIVAHLGVHYLDLAAQLLGEPVAVTVTDRAECRPGIDVRCAGVVTFASGATLAFTVTSCAPARAERLSIVGDAGHLDLVDGAVRAQIGPDTIDTPPVAGGELRRRVFDEFAASAADGTVPARSALARSRSVTWILQEIARVPAR